MAKLRQAIEAMRAPVIEIQRQQAAEMLEAIAQEDDEEAAAHAAVLLLMH
jgi:hypothetical protein